VHIGRQHPQPTTVLLWLALHQIDVPSIPDSDPGTDSTPPVEVIWDVPDDVEPVDPILPINLNPGQPLPAIPPSPYRDPSDVCVRRVGQVVEDRGFPSSPFPLTLFQREFVNPPLLQPVSTGAVMVVRP
jgi:hypothetical protein